MTEGTGHNSNAQLRSIVDRIVQLEEEKAERAEDIRGVFAEAKGNGFDPAALRVVVKEKREDNEKRKKRQEREEIVTVYRTQLGLPL